MGLIITRTPLRCSIAGGGTDMPEFYRKLGGHVVSFSIDKYVYVVIKERFDNLIVLNYTQHEIVNSVSEIKHDLIRECMNEVGVFGGVEISTLADIPSRGSGLGSSSAITIGLLLALYTYIGESVTKRELAEKACYIEIDKLQHPIGKQDQYACAFGGLNSIEFGDNGIGVDALGEDYYDVADNLFLHYTGISRSADSILKGQRNNIDSKIDNLLRLKGYAEDAHDAIIEKEYSKIGGILRQNWAYKSSLAEGISNKQLDDIISFALRNGASGCKLTGAGGGGYLLSYVPPEVHEHFRKAMKDFRELPFKVDKYGARVIFNIS